MHKTKGIQRAHFPWELFEDEIKQEITARENREENPGAKSAGCRLYRCFFAALTGALTAFLATAFAGADLAAGGAALAGALCTGAGAAFPFAGTTFTAALAGAFAG